MGPVWIATVNFNIIQISIARCWSGSLYIIKVCTLLKCYRQSEDHFTEMYLMAAAVESLSWSREPKAKSLLLAVVDMPVKKPSFCHLKHSWDKIQLFRNSRLMFGQPQSGAATRGAAGSERSAKLPVISSLSHSNVAIILHHIGFRLKCESLDFHNDSVRSTSAVKWKDVCYFASCSHSVQASPLKHYVPSIGQDLYLSWLDTESQSSIWNIYTGVTADYMC